MIIIQASYFSNALFYLFIGLFRFFIDIFIQIKYNQYGDYMKITFEKLYEHSFDIENLFAVKQSIFGKTTFSMSEYRRTDALLLFSGTTGICYQNGEKPMQIPLGALVYMPEGSTYTWENSPVNSNYQENLLFEFTLYDAPCIRGNTDKRELKQSHTGRERLYFGDKVTIVTVSHSDLFRKLFRELIEAFNRKDFSPTSVYATAFTVFDTLSRNLRFKQDYSFDDDIILSAIREFEGDEGLSVEEVAAKCCLSVSYFEKQFKKYSGVSPVEYKTFMKINKIKMLLQEKENTLEDIADALGYCDSGYLCRIFKKKTGMTPSEYRRLYFAQIKVSK